ncbi:MAG: hypothetical protein WCJ94_07070 [bacterium]
MRKNIFKMFLFLLFIILLPILSNAKTGFELGGSIGTISPTDFNINFSDAYAQIASPSIPITPDVAYKNSIYDISGTFKFSLTDNIFPKIVISYLSPQFETDLKVSPTKTLISSMSIPSGYAGAGADVNFNLLPGLFIFASGDAGAILQLGYDYTMDVIDGTSIKSKSIYLGDGVGYGANVKLGLQYMLTDNLGLSVFGGYKKAEMKIKYPDDVTFNTKDSGGNLLFTNKRADISGPIAGIAFLLYGNNIAKKEEAPSTDGKAVLPLLADAQDKKPELQKYTLMTQVKNFFMPWNRETVQLFVSTTVGKPQEKPSLNNKNLFSILTPRSPELLSKAANEMPMVKALSKGPVYTSASFGTFVDSRADKKRWFAFNLPAGKSASTIIWQVSTTPFNIGAKDWANPPNLLKSGKLPASTSEFLVDFGEAETSFATINKIDSLKTKIIPKKRNLFYVRVVAVNALGNPVLEPGKGDAVIIGEKVTRTFSTTPKYELQTPNNAIGNYDGEFQDRPIHHDKAIYVDSRGKVERVFFFQGVKEKIGELVLQVSDKPFSEDINAPVLYEKHSQMPIAQEGVLKNFPVVTYPSSVLLTFDEFGKKASEMKNNEYLTYYVRGFILKPASAPGIDDVEMTDTVTIQYGFGDSSFTWLGPKAPTYVHVNRSLPKMKMKAYTPVQWQAPDAYNHYYVYKSPTADEITCAWRGENEILYPYFYSQEYYAAQGIQNKQQYEQLVIPRVLKPGTLVYFAPPKEEDRAWYQQLYDQVVEFFTDLFKAADALVNQVANSYNNLKMGLINFVVSLCPVDSLKGYFKTALEGMVNYGLVALGLPPTLPNFDELSSMSIAYLATTALSEAGVPENEMTDEAVNKVAAGIREQVEKAAACPAPNPIGSAFLKLDPAYLYRPAYIDIDFINDTDYATVSGTFEINVTFEFDYWTMAASNYDPAGGIDFIYPNPYKVGSTAAITRSMEYMNHFIYGLNGNVVDYKNGMTAVYDVFAPVVAKTVPIVKPHATSTMRIYLEPYPGEAHSSFTRYPSGDNVTSDDFEVMYFANGIKQFTNFYLTGTFPTANQYEQSLGMYLNDPNIEYIYNSNGNVNDTAQKQPVSIGWSK